MPQVKVIQPLSEPSKKLRVAAYARVSSDSADQLNSFATQVDYYTGYIQSKDEWEFAGLYADEAISGITADKRSDFQRLLVDCHAGKIDRILVKSISRFARNTLDCIQTVRELKRLNIPVEFEKENIDTGSMGSEMLLSILGAAAQEESLSISKNLKWSYRHRMKIGDFTTHIAPFGYSYKSKTLVPNPNEVPIIEYIFNSYLSGKSLSEIAKELNQNEKSIASENHSEWNRTSIQYIQENCDLKTSDNLILYGHHMLDGGMFSDLDLYKKKSFWEKHKTIRFDTLDEIAEYEILAVIVTTAYRPDSFRYYEYTGGSQEQFEKYVSDCKRLSLYDTGVNAEYGDKLITLSTCEYSQNDGRLLVVAKKTED